MKYLIATVFVLFGMTYNAQAHDCADFAGNWRGECVTATGEKSPSALDIEQKGCTNLKVSTIGPNFLTIGDGLSFKDNSGGVATSTSFYTWWNKEKSVVEFFMHVEARHEEHVFQDNILGGYKFVGDKMVTYSRGDFGEVVCTHKK